MLSRLLPMVTAAAASEHKVAPALKDVLARASAASKKTSLTKPVWDQSEPFSDKVLRQ